MAAAGSQAALAAAGSQAASAAAGSQAASAAAGRVALAAPGSVASVVTGRVTAALSVASAVQMSALERAGPVLSAPPSGDMQVLGELGSTDSEAESVGESQ